MARDYSTRSLAKEYIYYMDNLAKDGDTYDDFYDWAKIPRGMRSDFATAAILKQAMEMLQGKITVVYSKNAPPISDFLVDDFVCRTAHDHKKNNECQVIETSSSILIDRFRLSIADGTIDANDIEFYFEKKRLEHNKYGAIVDCPKGFADKAIDICEHIITTSIKRKKKN